MEIKYEIADDKIRNFTDSAKSRLQEQAQKYTLEIISEAEKVEEFRRNKTEKKKSIKTILIRIAAEILLFVSGLMFIPEMFITPENTFNLGYFFVFAIVTLTALVATIVTYFIGGE